MELRVEYCGSARACCGALPRRSGWSGRIGHRCVGVQHVASRRYAGDIEAAVWIGRRARRDYSCRPFAWCHRIWRACGRLPCRAVDDGSADMERRDCSGTERDIDSAGAQAGLNQNRQCALRIRFADSRP